MPDAKYHSCRDTNHQQVALALVLAEEMLNGPGTRRAHGGGNAVTIQAFVPMNRMDTFRQGWEDGLDAAKCHVLHIVPDRGKLEYVREICL